MCLAILKPVGKHIIKRRLREGFRSNSHGAGFMYVANDQLQIDKGYFTFRSFYKAFRQAEHKYPDSNFVIHFRIATSGKTNAETCHPFAIDTTVGFVHNGIFPKLGNKHKSDTQQFNRQFLRQMPKDFIHNKKSIKFLDNYCGWFNKLIFLNNKNEFLIINEDAGQWLDGIWFSCPITAVGLYECDDDEQSEWDSCTVCNGYYPKSNLYQLENRQYVCPSCFAIASGDYRYQQIICPNCERMLDAYDDDYICPYCGELLKVLYV